MAGRQPKDHDRSTVFVRGVRLVGTYIRAHPKPFALALLGSFAFAVASVAVSVALGEVTDRVLRPAFGAGVPASTMWLGVAVLVGLSVGRAISIMVRRYYSGVAGAAAAAWLRGAVSDRYRQLPFDFHRTTPTGELLSHMEADVEASVDVYVPVPFAIGALLLAVFALGSLLLADPFLALTGLLIIPLIVLINHAFAAPDAGAGGAIASAHLRCLGDRSRVGRRGVDREDPRPRARRDGEVPRSSGATARRPHRVG